MRRTASYPPGTPGSSPTAICTWGHTPRHSPSVTARNGVAGPNQLVDAAHLSNPLGSALGCRPGITPIRPSASRAHIGLARPAHRRLELQRLNAVFDSLFRRHKMLLSLGFLSSFLSVVVLAEELQAAGASWHAPTDNPAAQHNSIICSALNATRSYNSELLYSGASAQ